MSVGADPSQTLYDELEVSPSASVEVIQGAYRSLVKRYHPDRNPGDAVAAERTRRVNDAYAVLSDPERRAAYDRELADTDRRKRTRAKEDWQPSNKKKKKKKKKRRSAPPRGDSNQTEEAERLRQQAEWLHQQREHAAWQRRQAEAAEAQKLRPSHILGAIVGTLASLLVGRACVAVVRSTDAPNAEPQAASVVNSAPTATNTSTPEAETAIDMGYLQVTFPGPPTHTTREVAVPGLGAVTLHRYERATPGLTLFASFGDYPTVARDVELGLDGARDEGLASLRRVNAQARLLREERRALPGNLPGRFNIVSLGAQGMMWVHRGVAGKRFYSFEVIASGSEVELPADGALFFRSIVPLHGRGTGRAAGTAKRRDPQTSIPRSTAPQPPMTAGERRTAQNACAPYELMRDADGLRQCREFQALIALEGGPLRLDGLSREDRERVEMTCYQDQATGRLREYRACVRAEAKRRQLPSYVEPPPPLGR